MGEPVEFKIHSEMESFRRRLYAAMSADARQSRALDDRADPGWGKHRWGAVHIVRLSDTALWIGRAFEPRVGPPVGLAEALGADPPI